jgi:hypothetical protein
MKTRATFTLLAVALLVFATIGCASGEETTTTGVAATAPSPTAAPQPTASQTTASTGQAVITTTPAWMTTTTRATSDDVLAEEYEVYSALIQTRFIDATHPTLIVIKDTTAKAGVGLFLLRDAVGAIRDEWPELGDEVLDDFQTKNQTSAVLEGRFTLNVKHELISEQGLQSILSTNGGWEDFYAEYPGSQGYLTLSRVGFDKAKDTAVLYLGTHVHGVAGGGHVVLMKKRVGGWMVRGERMLWIS